MNAQLHILFLSLSFGVLANASENALLMEFVLHGLSSYSMISKKVIDGKIEFKDLMGSMMNLGQFDLNEDDEDYQG